MRELADLITEYVNTHQAEYVAWLANKRRNEDGKKAEEERAVSCVADSCAVHRDLYGIKPVSLAD